MTRQEFQKFYDVTVDVLANKLINKYKEFNYVSNASAVYEEYLNQKTILRNLYGKFSSPDKLALLDRHKVCACMTAAIIKVRLISKNIETDENFDLDKASRANEQLAFLSAWEMFKGFIILHEEENDPNYKLPKPFHNGNFVDTITRSLFFANQLNSISTPLLANIFFLLEKYCNKECEDTK